MKMKESALIEVLKIAKIGAFVKIDDDTTIEVVEDRLQILCTECVFYPVFTCEKYFCSQNVNRNYKEVYYKKI